MKYKELPIEKELEAIRIERGDQAMVEARSALVEQLLRHPGFQIIVVLLRDIEKGALAQLRVGSGDRDNYLYWLRHIEYIRKAINEIVPSYELESEELEELEEFMPADIADF